MFTNIINPVRIIESRGGASKTKHYLTISEFASLRHVNVNSIRYYEKQNLLIPAWTDPQTKYRYYLPEQLGMLDAILLCIRLGIPLKDLKTYIDPNGKLDEKVILEKGKERIQAEIDAMQTGIEIMRFNLRSMVQNEQYVDQKGVYAREIEERFLIAAPFSGNWNDLIQKEKSAMDLFHTAQELNMAPVFPAGILIHGGVQPASYSFFFQVLHPVKEDPRILRIPKSSFSCLQAELTSQTDIPQILAQSFPENNAGLIIISNMLLSKLHFDSRHSEIQVPLSAL